jgi:Ring hydroxylating alpha subunit (catalytic domain)
MDAKRALTSDTSTGTSRASTESVFQAGSIAMRISWKPRRSAARYLNWRINRRVSAEDKVLIERVQTSMGSRSYSPGPLGRNEVSLRSFAHRMRELLPESRLEHAPAPGWGGIKSRLSRG